MGFRDLWKRWRGAIVLLALGLTGLNIWQYARLHSVQNMMKYCTEYRDQLFHDDENVAKAVELWKQDRGYVEKDKDFYESTWPNRVYLQGEACVLLDPIGLGSSRTYCFDAKNGKLTRSYSWPHG